MSRPTVALPRSITSQFKNAEILTAQIEAVTKHLSQLMDELHGEECQFDISHEAGVEFILVSPGVKRGRSSRG
ncbi:hypothetical protein M0654_03545 [Rhizobium sp. NTR19]|uniref:Uncharacterized protein n=1 Tax=Neorhizobium turbinariae TaxID=2937795 RepID=A0ABT0IMH0_9HYPH|nr:hypothetical protein [Neorhizobium turbinariae]MCK8779053.1 hypothetical protein [Neorhizobium turbinariae]